MFHYLVTFYGHEAANIQLVCLELYCVALCILAFVSQDVVLSANWDHRNVSPWKLWHLVWFLFTRANSSPPPTGNQTTSCDSTWKSDSCIFFFFFIHFIDFNVSKNKNPYRWTSHYWAQVSEDVFYNVIFFVKKEKKKKALLKTQWIVDYYSRRLLKCQISLMTDYFQSFSIFNADKNTWSVDVSVFRTARQHLPH